MMTEAEIQALVLYRDASVLILNKPAGLPAHKGPKGGETMDDHLSSLRYGLDHRPALAHRLDKDTSGCLALGRHPRAINILNRLFADRGTTKEYWALLCGVPDRTEGTISAPLARASSDPRSWWMKVDGKGQPAETRWQVLGTDGRFTAVALFPLTGRTHQLRVHMAYLGYPIAGDGIYGGPPARSEITELQLHARRLVLPFHHGKPPIDVTAPLPYHMLEHFKACGVTADI